MPYVSWLLDYADLFSCGSDGLVLQIFGFLFVALEMILHCALHTQLL